MPPSTEFRVRENRARRAAERMGFTLTKSRRRDPAAVDFGEYRLTVADERARFAPTTQPLLSLDDVEAEVARLADLAARGRG